nr:immunoglobulin light chain junction region [Macaca mulatta]
EADYQVWGSKTDPWIF